MTNRFRFDRLSLISTRERAAQTIKLKPGLNVIHGTNNVGKSTVVKSLFASIGAEVSNLRNPKWVQADVIYSVDVSINAQSFTIVRQGKHYGVFDANSKLAGRYYGVTGDDGIGSFFRQKLSQEVSLPTKNGFARVTPPFLFSPAYIDQDSGWNHAFSSFGLQMFSSSKKAVIDYHLGIRGKKSLALIERRAAIEGRMSSEETNIKTVERVRRRYTTRYSARSSLPNMSVLSEALDRLTVDFNKAYERRTIQMDAVQVYTNQKLSLNSEIELLKRSLRELSHDFDFLVNDEKEDTIDCPTCGAEYDNDFVARFGLASDVSAIEQVLKERLEQLRKVRAKEDETKVELAKAESVLAEIRSKLVETKQGLTFQQVVLSESFREAVTSFDNELADAVMRKLSLDDQRDKVRKEERDLRAELKGLKADYARMMRSALSKLDVTITDARILEDIYRTASTETLGSDVPRFILARTAVLRSLMAKYNSEIDLPFVIDSPFQQEQDSDNEALIWDFIKGLADGRKQIIVATINDKVANDVKRKKAANLIKLTEKFGLLN